MTKRLQFIDLFAGLGGFHKALADLGHECVFASELDPDLRACYSESFPDMAGPVVGDITLAASKALVPKHDVLCAGFPCQPFSKSGYQQGFDDPTRGTLFHEIVEILETHKPEYLILENVGNFERHDGGKTWRIVRDRLISLNYDIAATLHKATGGPGLLSPHHLGYPQTRERFFIVGRRRDAGPLPTRPFPPRLSHGPTEQDLLALLDPNGQDEETKLTDLQLGYIDHWKAFLDQLGSDVKLPSFPVWADELWWTYPYEDAVAPLDASSLRQYCLLPRAADLSDQELVALLPSYARRPDPDHPWRYPKWKEAFIRQNRAWLSTIRPKLSDDWVDTLSRFPHSYRKFEWNCQGAARDPWQHVIQLRPSGIRVKRFTSCPALVSLTETQIPIIGPRRRFLSRIEGLQLQGFEQTHKLPKSKSAAFAALGNAVHVGVVKAIAERLLAAEGAPAVDDDASGMDVQLVLLEAPSRASSGPLATNGNGVHRETAEVSARGSV